MLSSKHFSIKLDNGTMNTLRAWLIVNIQYSFWHINAQSVTLNE